MPRRAAALMVCFSLLISCGSGATRPAPSSATAPPTAASLASSTTSGTAAPSPSPTSRPSPTNSPSPTPSPPVTYCRVADELTAVRDYDRHAETVLDPTYALPSDYVPPDLVSALSGESAAGGERIRKIAYPDLSALRAAAASAGHPLAMVSGYRSYSDQAATFDHWVSVGGYEQALLTSARAGHSEHQLGTSVDLGDGSRPPWEYPDFGETPSGSWLLANAVTFGFVVSYPNGKTDVTCYAYEPWHLRWVGRDIAAKVTASGLTLHEYQTAAP